MVGTDMVGATTVISVVVEVVGVVDGVAVVGLSLDGVTVVVVTVAVVDSTTVVAVYGSDTIVTC